MEGSYVYFKDGQVHQASNDGMELLGHFLLTQVGAQGAFFIDFLRDSRDREISAGPYFLETIGDVVSLEHLENERVQPFETTRKNMLDIVHHWEGVCRDEKSSACKVGGYDSVIKRSADGASFSFETVKK